MRHSTAFNNSPTDTYKKVRNDKMRISTKEKKTNSLINAKTINEKKNTNKL